MNVVIGCVTEDNPKYLGQTLRLLQSIRWFGGALAHARVVVGAVDRIDPRARRALERLGADIRVVPRFHPGNGSGNRLQLFEEIWDGGEETILFLDCDTIVVQDPLPLLRRDGFHSKIAPLPTVTHEVFERLFAREGLPLPPRNHVTGYIGTPTIPYFNAGVIAVSPDIAKELVPAWKHYNKLYAEQPELVAPCERHLHQAALAMALAATGVPVAEMGPELNFQLNMTQFPTPPGYDELDPYLIHYHHLVDGDGFLLPCPFPRAQQRVEQFNARLRQERGTPRPSKTASSAKRIAVLGMHRSGTSLVARLLAAMGCHAGEEQQLPSADVYNPTGYWEHRQVVALNEEILDALDASWLDPAHAGVERLTDDARRSFVGEARAIAESLDPHGTWMIKDPRLSILFPLWREALGDPLCVLVWRDPAAVARSVAARDGLPVSLGVVLWQEYTRAMLEATAGLRRVLVSYDDLIADPVACVARLHAELGGLRLPSPDELRAIVEAPLDRHAAGDDVPLDGSQIELRDALRNRTALDRQTIAPPSREGREMLSMAGRLLHENDKLRARLNEREDDDRQLEQLLSEVFSSRSWRIGFGITRMWRRLVPSRAETALDHWNRRAGKP